MSTGAMQVKAFLAVKLLLLAFLACPVFSATVFNAAQQTVLLNLHNNERSGLGATEMYKLVWDDATATSAQSWADQSACNISHSHWPGLGENLAWGSPLTQAYDALAAAWITSEKQYYTLSSNSCAAGQVCGHYTQLVWGKTTKLGCGMATCGTTRYVVCQYKAPGNYIGQSPYAVGTPCSACINGCEVDGKLCSAPPQSCQLNTQFTFSGGTVQTTINDLYIPVGTMNGAPSYRSSLLQWYTYRIGTNQWVIDSDLNPSGYNGYVFDSASTPWTITGTWNILDSTSQWQLDASFHATQCSNAGTITAAPTTLRPTTLRPTTLRPTTLQPTTLRPTTLHPTAVLPTTSRPTTVTPTTVRPTTSGPTAQAPITLNPTTLRPTTPRPTTSKPTPAPTQTAITPTLRPTTVRPTTLSPVPKPTTRTPTTKSPTNTPTTKAPINQPTTKAPTPRPTTKNPTPKPTTKAPIPKPTTSSPIPKPTRGPTTQRPTTPKPTTKTPTPKPTTKTPTAKPTTRTPTPKPTTRSPTSKPTTKSPI